MIKNKIQIQIKLLLFFFLYILQLIHGFDVISWFVGDGQINNFTIDKINWDIYTHIKSSYSYVYPNGSAYCNKNDIIIQKLTKLAHSHNRSIVWGLGLDLHQYLFINRNQTIINNYLNTINQAMNDCNIDGIQVDYEFSTDKLGKYGIVTKEYSDTFTHFLANLKSVIGNKTVSADIGIWGLHTGVYPLGFLPWINVDMLNAGKIDYVNIMSYQWDKHGDISQYERDIYILTKIWKIDPKRINLGIPYYTQNLTGFFKTKIYNEPTWGELSKKCPNIDINKNICDNILFVGKKMNQDIGRLVKEKGLRGVFPWAANYDSVEYNNSLITWLAKGLYSI